MVGIIFAGWKVYWPQKIILDFTELTYVWGDRMFNIITMGKKETFAIVLGPKSKEAILSLIGASDIKGKWVNMFETIEEALEYIKDLDGNF